MSFAPMGAGTVAKGALNTINTKIVETASEVGGETSALLQSRSKTASDQTAFVLDRDWEKVAFLLNDEQLADAADRANRYWSSASAKYTDTRIGGNIGINSKPQFTRYSDVRVKGRLSGRNEVSTGSFSGNYGMGRYYSEAIDDPSQTIYLRFGVPQFNSLSNFLAKVFNPEMSSLARTGKGTSFFWDLGAVAGTIVGVVNFPKTVLFMAAGKLVNSFFIRPTSKFYTLKPTMMQYWSSVDNLVNALAVNRGILPRILAGEDKQRIGEPFTLDQEYLKSLSEMMPDYFSNESGYINVPMVANRAQRIANQQFEEDMQRLDNGTASDFLGYVKKLTGDGTHATHVSDKDGKATYSALLNVFSKLGYYTKKDKDEKIEIDPRINKDDPKGAEKKEDGFFQTFKKFIDAELRAGSDFLCFKVEHTGSVSESFSNSTTESDISSKLNGVSSQIRQAKFSFSDGNLIGGLPGMVQSALGAAFDVVAGAADKLTLGFSSLLLGMSGGGYIDIPKVWQSSSATLPRSTYTATLISPYGNAFSQLQNIYIPLCALMAGTLPLSTGKQSYTSPFLCQIFDRGRCQTRLGIIESLTITRGTSSLPFDTLGRALAIEVSFTVADLSSIMHMPMSTGALGEVNMCIDEDNILADYLSVLAGQDIYSQIYYMPKAKLALAKNITKIGKMTSPAYWANMTLESARSGTLAYMTLGLSSVAINVLEGAARGSEVTSGAKT